jgi:hypothetical protein
MKDYYRVLGVLRNAEEIVIKAAYKALAQKYHPDRVPDLEKVSATQKMMEINEAKDVLLDPVKRSEYNKKYDDQNVDRQSYGSEFKEQEQFSETSLRDDEWNTAVNYFPDLKKIIKELGLISTNLTNLYKNYMLESRQFDERHKIKAIIENDYLTRFYGDDEKTRTYVKSLLLNNFKHAAIEINKHVLVMGNSIKYKQIYPKIEKIFPEAKVCRLPLEVQPRLRLRRLNNIRLDNLISKIETQEIWNTETIELFEAIFNTEVEPIGFGEERTYIFTLNSRKYNQDLNYLKNKIIEHLDVDN